MFLYLNSRALYRTFVLVRAWEALSQGPMVLESKAKGLNPSFTIPLFGLWTGLGERYLFKALYPSSHAF